MDLGCKELERARKQVGLPSKQPLLQLQNSSKTVPPTVAPIC